MVANFNISLPRQLLRVILCLFVVVHCSHARVLFLEHWNGKSIADHAEGNPFPLMNDGNLSLAKGGYPFKNSMPAVGGLTISESSALAYETAGNINPEEGTLDFWFYPRSDFESGRDVPTLFITNDGPDKPLPMHNIFELVFRGWEDRIAFAVVGANGESTNVQYSTHKWKANTKWHRIAITWSRSQKVIALYVDGKLAERKENVVLPVSLPRMFFVGSRDGRSRFALHSFDELRILDRQITDIEAAVDYYRADEFNKDDAFSPASLMVPISISAVAKTPFVDEQANDQKGGWTDQGPTNDMRSVNKGDISVFGIPFRVGDACIALANDKRTYYPQYASIEINDNYGGLLFIHTAAWLTPPNRTLANYVVEYSDNTNVAVPLKSRDNIGDWWYLEELPAAKPVPITDGRNKGAYLYFWKNPNPEKPIKFVTMQTTNDEAMPILIAMTGVKASVNSEVYNGLSLLTAISKNVAEEFANAVSIYKNELLKMENVKAELAKIKLTEKELSSFYGREVLRQIAEANIYLDEVASLKADIFTAIDRNDFQVLNTIEKSTAYIRYVQNILKTIPDLQTKAANAVLMNRIKPQPISFSSDVIDFLTRYARQQIIMNGTWEYSESVQPDNCGGKSWSEKAIPFRMVTGEEYKEARRGVYWFKKSIAIPGCLQDKKIELWFEDSRYITEVYVNREYVGRHIGIEPFGIDITSKVVFDASNEILLFVADLNYLYNEYYNGYAYLAFIKPYPEFGIRQDVVLNITPQVSISDQFAWIDSNNAFTISGRVCNFHEVEKPLELEVSVISETESYNFGSTQLVLDSEGFFRVSKPWSKPILWGIGGQYGEPNLVSVSLKLSSDREVLDELNYRTGFSKIEIRDNLWFYLNGRKIVLQGDHFWAGESHCAPATRAFLNRYYRIAREANFNIVRSHLIEGGNVNSTVLDTADELGFLVMPEGLGLINDLLPKKLNGVVNLDDPVFRSHAETYHRALARKLRIHPSVMVLSLSNEIFLGAGPYSNDALKYFMAMEKIVAQEMPQVILTESGSNSYNEFRLRDLHYAQGKPLENWKERGDRPLLHSEWSFYEGGYFEMNHLKKEIAAKAQEDAAANFEKEIKFEIENGVAGTMPFPAYYIYSFCSSDEDLMGPFGDVLSKMGCQNSNNWYMPYSWSTFVPITNWPSMSGRGVKISHLYTGSQADNINFFDKSRKEFTPNKVYDAFKRAFMPMPSVRQFMNPEVIVEVNHKDNNIYPVWVALKNNPVLFGVVPDEQGKAWFELPLAADYSFVYFDGSHIKSNDFGAEYKSIQQSPGFDYIDRVNLSN